LTQPFSVKLSRRPFSQVLCDFSFKTVTFSTSADPGRNDLDEQKSGDDRENNEQIEIFFRHLSLRFSKKEEQCRDRY
jgi:hypothetical protein